MHLPVCKRIPPKLRDMQAIDYPSGPAKLASACSLVTHLIVVSAFGQVSRAQNYRWDRLMEMSYWECGLAPSSFYWVLTESY